MKKFFAYLFMFLLIFSYATPALGASLTPQLRETIFTEERKKVIDAEKVECEKGKRKLPVTSLSLDASECAGYFVVFLDKFAEMFDNFKGPHTVNGKVVDMTWKEYLMVTTDSKAASSDSSFRSYVKALMNEQDDRIRNNALAAFEKQLAGDDGSPTDPGKINNPDAGSDGGNGRTTGNGLESDYRPSASGTCGDPDLELVNGRCVPRKLFCNAEGSIACASSWYSVVKYGIYLMLTLAGIVAVIYIILGGYKYMTAGGNADQAGEGRKTLVNAIVGLIIVMTAFGIVQIVINTIQNPGL